MIIKKMIIYGYGKWIDTEFDIDASFQLFFGENEAGKSTIMSFIHSVFFGFPTRHSSLNRYEPNESSRYGGKIIIQDKRFGEVSIERVSGKVTGDVVVQLEDGTTGNEAMLTTLFYNKTRSFYESIYSFDLKGIENIQNMGKEQLNRFFLSVGALGHEKYLKQADYYNAQADKLFKPMGRNPKINQLKAALKSKAIEVEKAKEKNETYIDLMKQHIEKQEQLKIIESKLSKTEKELNYFDQLSRHEETLAEIDEIKAYLKNKPVLKLPEDGLYQLRQINNDTESYQNEINERQERQKNLQKEYKPSKELVLYQENEEHLKQFENNLDFWEDQAHSLQLKMKDLGNIEQMIAEMKIREDISLSDSLPIELKTSELDYLNTTRERLEKSEVELSDLQDKQKNITHKININNDMIDKIEPKLLSLSGFNKLKEMNEEGGEPGKGKRQSHLVPMIASAVTFFSSIYLFTVEPVYGVAIFILFIVLTYATWREHSSLNKQENKEQHTYYEQKNLRSQWKEMLAMNDVYQSEYKDTLNQINRLETTKQLIQKDFGQWKKDHLFPASITLLNIDEKRDIYEKIRELSNKEAGVKQTIETIETKLNNHLSDFERVFKRDFLTENTLEKFKEMRNIYREIKNEQRGMQEYIKQTETIQNEINYFVGKVNELKSTKQQFIHSLELEREEDVYDIYAEQDIIQEKRMRLSMLLAKLPPRDDQNEIKYEVTNLDVNMKKLSEEKRTLLEQQKEINKNIMADEMTLKQLEDGGLYSEILQTFENEKSYYQEIVYKWTTFKTAAGIIEKTLHYAKKDNLPQALSVAETYFSFLTNDKYKKLQFEQETLFIIDKWGNKWKSEDLSRGTVEPLYISLRLAFVKTAKEKIQFPILIDDPFVNLDNQRVKKMYELLSKFDENIQIIYFSFDPRIQAFIGDDKYVYLN